MGHEPLHIADGATAPLSSFARRLALRAGVSLTAIAILVLLGQLLIQQVVDRQVADSRLVNLAGRQRMLSQRLAKAALAISTARDAATRRERVAELEETTDLLERVHHALQFGDAHLALPGSNSPEVAEALAELEPHLRRLVVASRSLIAALSSGATAEVESITAGVGGVLAAEPDFLHGMEKVMDTILGEEPAFLGKMERIVAGYEHEARTHVMTVKRHQWLFVGAVLGVVSFLGLGVLWPAIRELRRSIELREVEERVRLNRSLLQASTRERERIGRDLHDGLGQVLAGIGMMSRVLAQRLAALGLPEAAAASKIEAHVSEAIAHTRELARELHPVEIAEGGLGVALQSLAEYAETTLGVRCTVEQDAWPSVSDAAAAQVYRIAQEAVTNAAKHGKAACVTIALRSDGGLLRLTVSDDGTGVATERPPTRGLGLGIMRDRARLLGGNLEVRKAAGGGTVVTASFDPQQAEQLVA
jgi:signal transduction histidine kinase